MTAPARTASRPPQAAAAAAAGPGTSTRAAARVDAGGTMWRLRSLVAMGHDATRLACALGTSPRAARRIITGEAATVSLALRDAACELWDAWWDKRPPEDTAARRRTATAALHLARWHNWCQPLGLDEEYLDEPGYRPYAIWRPAAGTGVAPGFSPAAHQPGQDTASRPRPRARHPEPGHPPAWHAATLTPRWPADLREAADQRLIILPRETPATATTRHASASRTMNLATGGPCRARLTPTAAPATRPQARSADPGPPGATPIPPSR